MSCFEVKAGMFLLVSGFVHGSGFVFVKFLSNQRTDFKETCSEELLDVRLQLLESVQLQMINICQHKHASQF